MKKTIVTAMAIVAMLLTCNMASAAKVAIYTSTGASAERILSVFRAVKAMNHDVHGIGYFDILHGRLKTGIDGFDVLIVVRTLLRWHTSPPASERLIRRQPRTSWPLAADLT